jgi:Phosphatase
MLPMPQLSLRAARAALVSAGITGPHQSHGRAKNIQKIHALLEGATDDDFGLSGLDRYSGGEVLGFLADLTGCSADIADMQADELIDPDKTIQGVIAAGERLRDHARRGGSLLVVTGHPTGLLEMHMRVVDAFRECGGKSLRLREEEHLTLRGKPREVRYIGGVGCVADWGQLLHTHSSAAMERLLDAQPWPEMVLGDHGFAGAAIERGIPTIAVMDINDSALSVAAAEGRDVIIIPMDDNRPPRLYEPVWRLIEQILEGDELE